jgi:hypothetical protein
MAVLLRFVAESMLLSRVWYTKHPDVNLTLDSFNVRRRCERRMRENGWEGGQDKGQVMDGG